MSRYSVSAGVFSGGINVGKAAATVKMDRLTLDIEVTDPPRRKEDVRAVLTENVARGVENAYEHSDPVTPVVDALISAGVKISTNVQQGVLNIFPNPNQKV